MRCVLALVLLLAAGCAARRACWDHCPHDGTCVFLIGKDGQIGSATLEESTWVLCCGGHYVGEQQSPPSSNWCAR